MTPRAASRLDEKYFIGCLLMIVGLVLGLVVLGLGWKALEALS